MPIQGPATIRNPAAIIAVVRIVCRRLVRYTETLVPANAMIISADAGRATAFAKYAAPRTIPVPKAVLALVTHLSDMNRLVPQQKSPAMRRSGVTRTDHATLRKAVIQNPMMIATSGSLAARRTQKQPNRKTTTETAIAAWAASSASSNTKSQGAMSQLNNGLQTPETITSVCPLT